MKLGTRMFGRTLMRLIGHQMNFGSITCLRIGMTHGRTGTGETLQAETLQAETLQANGHGTTALRWLAIQRLLLEL